MGVVEAKIQTVEDIYRLVWAAVANKRPRMEGLVASFQQTTPFTRLAHWSLSPTLLIFGMAC